MNQFFHIYVLIGTLTVCFAVLMAWMFIASKVHYLIRLAVMTFGIVAAFVVWQNTVSIFGYPVDETPSGRVKVLDYSTDKEHIYLWVQSENGLPRAYAIPYSNETASKLAEGKKAAQGMGGHMEVSFSKGDGENHGHGNLPGGNGSLHDPWHTGQHIDIQVVPNLPAKPDA